MGQVTIYLDSKSEKRMKQAAKTAGLPVSRWLAQLVSKATREQWPKTVRDAAGAWTDFPEADELRKGLANDSARESL